jgi:hypothetical protein
MTVVTDLVLADVDLNGAGLAGDNYHLRLAQLVREGEQLSHALRLFAAHPDQRETLRQQPELVAAAGQEVLRTEPITPFTARICLRPVEHRGVLFPEGTIVAAWPGRERPGRARRRRRDLRDRLATAALVLTRR